MALPIRDLESLVRERAKPKAVCVAKISRSRGEGFVTVCKIAGLTVGLKFVLRTIAKTQAKLITLLADYDFNACDPASLEELAKSIDKLVSDERDALDQTLQLGYELRAFWPLDTLQAQVEHLDSIAESLHVAADPGGMALLAFAVEQVAVR
jgi:hypothetical protein